MWDENYYSCCVGSSNSSATDTGNSRTVAGSGRVFSNYLHGGALSYFCVLNWKIRILFSSLLLGYSAYYLLLFHVANRARRKTETRAAKGVSVDTLTFKFTLLQIAVENCCILSIPKRALTTGHQASMPFRMDAKKRSSFELNIWHVVNALAKMSSRLASSVCPIHKKIIRVTK